MSIIVYETLDSMSGSITNDLEQGETREVRRSYVIGQCEGFNDVVARIEPYAPSYVSGDGAGLYWRRTRLEVVGIGNKYFSVTATYATLVIKAQTPTFENPEPDKIAPGSLAWDTTGNTEHITQAELTIRYPETAPDFEGAINVSGDSVNGLDVVRPCLRYSETWILAAELAVSEDYIHDIVYYTGTVNFKKFRGFEPRTALFMGARAQWQGDLPYVAVTFDFEVRPHTSLYIKGLGGDDAGETKIEKDAWEYLWFLYETEPSNGRLVQRPRYAYLHTVYLPMDWSEMKITDKQPAVPRNPFPEEVVGGEAVPPEPPAE